MRSRPQACGVKDDVVKEDDVEGEPSKKPAVDSIDYADDEDDDDVEAKDEM